MTQETNYPLHWPMGWKRTPAHDRKRANFNKKGTNDRGWTITKELSMQDSCKRLLEELKRLGTDDFILSTNLLCRLDGMPRSDQRKPEDCGVAVYFQIGGVKRVLACDKWDRVEDNIAAIAAHIDAIRRQDRYGVGTLDQAFAGYAALPAPNRHWSSVLDCPAMAEFDDIKTAYNRMAKKYHPDQPDGSTERMAEINAAYAEAKKEKGYA